MDAAVPSQVFDNDRFTWKRKTTAGLRLSYTLKK
jgi:hypothetical protein